MAFSKGRESNAVGGIKRYIGVGLFKCEGLNLSNKQLSELYGHEITGDEKQFIQEVDLNGVKTVVASLNFTLSTMIDDKKEFFNVRYRLFKAGKIGATSGKAMVMDEYGRTAWATQEEFESHAIPTYASGPANITANYRGIYRGEELLTRNDGSDLGFFTALLNIPNVTKFDDGKPNGLIDNPEDALCRLEHVEKIFEGDFSELQEILSYQPENELKLLVGVRKDDQNRLWQDFFVNFPMRASTRSYTKLSAALEDAKNNGGFANTDFEVCDLKVYEEAPTTIAQQATPVGAPTSPWFQKPKA